MKKKLATITTTVIAAILLASVAQQGNAVPYYGHDGSVDENITKYKVEPLKGKKNYWYYSVKVCADKYTMGIAGVILKSDMDQKVLGVNKNIKKGECKTYGAVMKAKNGESLGGELIEQHEAVQKMLDLKKDKSKLTKSQYKIAMKEWAIYFHMTGFNPR